MNPKLAKEIQIEQEHGRQKYGSGRMDLAHDDSQSDELWHECITTHNGKARQSTPMDRRQHLVKLAGLAISAIESFDRKNGLQASHPEDTCERCEGINVPWFAPNELWNRFHGDYSILCPTCFITLSDWHDFQAHWEIKPEKL